MRLGLLSGLCPNVCAGWWWIGGSALSALVRGVLLELSLLKAFIMMAVGIEHSEGYSFRVNGFVLSAESTSFD
jgi:hypothetical protein